MTILWKLGYPGDFTLTGQFTADTDWFSSAQHYPNILEATDTQITSLGVMDDGNARCYATPAGCGNSIPPPGAFTGGAIFAIDESAMTASLAWQYVVQMFGQNNVNAYSFWGGNVRYLMNGNIEICASEPVPVGAPIPTRTPRPR